MNYRLPVIIIIVCSLSITVASCKQAEDKVVFSKELPTLIVKDGAVEVKQMLEIIKKPDRLDFPYVSRIILTISPRVASEVDDVYVVGIMPAILAENGRDLTITQPPMRLLEDKPAMLFHFNPLQTSTKIIIQNQKDGLPAIALRYDASGKYRFLPTPLPAESKFLGAIALSFWKTTWLYGYDHVPTRTEEKAAVNYFKTHEPTLNQISSAGHELSIIYATAFDAIVRDGIDSLDNKTAQKLSSYKSGELYSDNKQKAMAVIAKDIPHEIMRKSVMSPVKIIALLESQASSVIDARERVRAEALNPVKVKKEPPAPPQPAIVITKRADTNNDGGIEKFHVYRLPDNTYQIAIVDPGNKNLFLSDPFNEAPKRVDVKKDESSKYPIYVVIFEESSGQGAFIGFNGTEYGYLTLESF